MIENITYNLIKINKKDHEGKVISVDIDEIDNILNSIISLNIDNNYLNFNFFISKENDMDNLYLYQMGRKKVIFNNKEFVFPSYKSIAEKLNL